MLPTLRLAVMLLGTAGRRAARALAAGASGRGPDDCSSLPAGDAEFVLVEGARERFTLTWHHSYEDTPPVEDADSALARTEAWWRRSSARCAYQGAYRDDVLSSLSTLKAMTSETTGAVIAAPTTSLPEDIGGVRNWDYRYCWLRDSVLALRRCSPPATSMRRLLSAIVCCGSGRRPI